MVVKKGSYSLSTMLISFHDEVLTLHLKVYFMLPRSSHLAAVVLFAAGKEVSLPMTSLISPLPLQGWSIVFLASGNLHFVGVVFAQVEELSIPTLLLNFTPNAKTLVYKSY